MPRTVYGTLILLAALQLLIPHVAAQDVASANVTAAKVTVAASNGAAVNLTTGNIPTAYVTATIFTAAENTDLAGADGTTEHNKKKPPRDRDQACDPKYYNCTAVGDVPGYTFPDTLTAGLSFLAFLAAIFL